MRKFLKNERGSGVLLTIFNFAIVGILLALIINIAMVYTKKEQASIAAEHASLAATSVLYDEVNKVVDSYVKVVDIKPDEGSIEIIKTLKEKVEERERELVFLDPTLTKNERRIQAIDDILSAEVRDDGILAMQVSDAVRAAEANFDSVIKDIISKNHGKDAAEDYDWQYKDYHIVVQAETEFEPTQYNGIQFGSKEDISQVGTGPEISFLRSLGW